MVKPINTGAELFHELVESDCYYVDKTPFIETVFNQNKSKVMLITRPRRFGKTLTMSTFYDFLSFNPENPDDVSRQEGWFKDTEICRNAEYRDFC
ncbi:MAG: AAA family ATPase, partial [Succinivibrionaceae bacterium]|nr:AAA family ATPase [Succinivibrionaceae bacterium]